MIYGLFKRCQQFHSTGGSAPDIPLTKYVHIGQNILLYLPIASLSFGRIALLSCHDLRLHAVPVFFHKQNQSEDHNKRKHGCKEQACFQITSDGIRDSSNHSRTHRCAQISR